MVIRRIILISSLFGLIVLCFFLNKKQEKEKKRLDVNYKYVVGEIYDYSSNHRSSNYSVFYTFFFNGKKYASSIDVSKWTGSGLKEVKIHRGHYIVKVSPEEPSNNKMMLEIPVRFVPAVLEDSGWKEIPTWIIELNKKKYGDEK